MADTLDSESSARKGVEVQVLSRAPIQKPDAILSRPAFCYLDLGAAMKWSLLALSLLLCASAVAAESQPDEPDKWTGVMQEGRVYSVTVIYKSPMWWPQGLIIPHHHAVHVGWENWEDFPAIPKQPKAGQAMKWTWRVVSKQIWKVHGRNQWRTSFSCRILRVEEEGERGAADAPQGQG